MAVARHRPLSDRAFHHFWVSWKRGRVSVGSGLVVGKNIFMVWSDPHPHAVNYIGVSTGWGSSGDWKFGKDSLPPVVGILTDNDYVYRSVPALDSQLRNRKSFSFSVKASNDAHIALQTYRGDTVNKMYEIVIGGWSNCKSVIRAKKQGTNLAYAFHHPLSASNYRPFWISFGWGKISVGAGTVVGSHQFMSWRDRNPTTIRFVSVATGWGATGHWLFYPKK